MIARGADNGQDTRRAKEGRGPAGQKAGPDGKPVGAGLAAGVHGGHHALHKLFFVSDLVRQITVQEYIMEVIGDTPLYFGLYLAVSDQCILTSLRWKRSRRWIPP